MERELWSLLYAIATRLSERWGSWKYSRADIVGTYLWAALMDRPMVWAVNPDHWPAGLRPRRLPSQSALSRRMRTDRIQRLMIEIEAAFLGLVAMNLSLLHVIDGKPLPVSGVSKDRDAGYGRGAGGMQKGYKLHAVWGDGPLPRAWGLASMNTSEKTMARYLIASLPGGGYLLGDSNFDAAPLYELAHQAGYQLLVPRKKGRALGHRRQSPHRLRSIELLEQSFGKELFRFRPQIERTFGNLTSFGGGLTCLPAWVRRLPRVRNWVHAKLLINAARWLFNHPDVLATA